MAMADKNHMLIKVNPAFLEMWGYAAADECVGRHASEFHDFSESAQDVIAAVRAAGTWTGRLVCIRKDGGRLAAEAAASAMRDCKGNIVGYMASFTQVPDANGLKQTGQNQHGV